MRWLALAAVIGGCNFAPNLEPVALPTPDQWPEGIEAAVGEETLGRLAWDRFFVDPALQGLIREALEHNRELREAALDVEAARARYRVRRGDWYPSFDASTEVHVQRVPGTLSRFGAATAGATGGGGEVVSTWRADVGLSAYEIDFFGRIKNLNQAALQQYFATEEVRRSVRLTLTAEVATAWLTLLADQARLALTEDTLRAQRESLALVRRRFDAGVTNALALRQAESQVQRALADRAALQRQVALDRNALTLLVGKPVPLDPLPAPEGEVLRDGVPPGLPSALLVNRPDIRAAEHRLRAANAEIGAARAAFFPSISLTGSVGTAATSLTDLFTPESFTWSFLPRITIPIFQGGAWANLDLTEIRKHIAIVQYERAIQVAFREVADALASRAALAEQLQAQTALADSLRDAYELSRLRYETGVDDYLVVLDSQRALYDAEQAQVQLRLALQANLITLYRVLGGGELPAR